MDEPSFAGSVPQCDDQRAPMKFFYYLVIFLCLFIEFAFAESPGAPNGIKPASVDMAAVRDAMTLETKVIQDWMPASKEPTIRQKLIEITVCEWWSGQKVRLPVTLNVPGSGEPCKNIVVSNMGLGLRPTLPTGAMLKLLKENGVGIVLVGMSTIDTMAPAGMLHLGMKEQLLKTKDARFTPAWIWGMSDMRALTAAVAESEAFQPTKVLATGGSKRGVAAAAAGIHDSRFTAILPVVAPPLGNPGGAYVSGTEAAEVVTANEVFLAELAKSNPLSLPDTARTALIDRHERRAKERISRDEAKAAGWSETDMIGMNDRAWDFCRITLDLPATKQRGLEIFYNVGTNDSVSPALVELGKRFPNFPVYIVPSGQHGGPKDAGFTHEVPSRTEVNDNLYSFAMHHFFAARAMIATPNVATVWNSDSRTLRVTARFSDGTEPQKNELSWSLNRHVPYTLAFEYDAWQSIELIREGPATFVGTISLAEIPKSLELLTTHTHTTQDLPLSISGPLLRIDTSIHK